MISGAPRVGRDGALWLRVERRDGISVVVGCRSMMPLQILAPVALDDRAAVVSVLNPTGGLVGGDDLDVAVEVGPGAHACLTTPSATKVYRTVDAPAVQRVRAAVASSAVLEWVPDHTIPFPGAAFRQTIDVELGRGAVLIAVDAFAAGRVARGEAWRFTRLDSALTVRDDEGWILSDRFVLDGALEAGALGAAEGHPYWATVVVAADTGLDGFAAEIERPVAGARLGAAALPRRGAVVRCLAADAPALTTAVDRVWAAARHHVLRLPALPLRKP